MDYSEDNFFELGTPVFALETRGGASGGPTTGERKHSTRERVNINLGRTTAITDGLQLSSDGKRQQWIRPKKEYLSQGASDAFFHLRRPALPKRKGSAEDPPDPREGTLDIQRKGQGKRNDTGKCHMQRPQSELARQ